MRLKDFIVCPDPDVALQILSVVLFLGWGDGRVDDIEKIVPSAFMLVVEEVTQQFEDAAQPL